MTSRKSFNHGRPKWVRSTELLRGRSGEQEFRHAHDVRQAPQRAHKWRHRLRQPSRLWLPDGGPEPGQVWLLPCHINFRHVRVDLLQEFRHVEFSEQYLLDCGRTFGLDGCDGGAANFVTNVRLELLEDYPCQAREERCPYDDQLHPNLVRGSVRMQKALQLVKRAFASFGPTGCVRPLQGQQSMERVSRAIFERPRASSLDLGAARWH